jgi:hypothetical protein
MFDKIPEAGELVTAQSEWRDSVDESGSIPEFIALLGDQKDIYHYEPVYGINFFQQSGNYDPSLNVNTDPTNDWTNADAKALYKQVALDICATYHPRYLGLAVEVNSYYLKHTADFSRFVVFYKELYGLIKADYPDTKVFVTFQLEMMKGLGDAIWGFPVDPHWEVLDLFDGKLDLIVFTSYPEVEYSSPEELPDDYYTEITQHTSRKIAFTEIGWSCDHSTEAIQSRFIIRFLHLTGSLDLEFVDWIYMHDLPGSGFPSTVGLRYTNGTAKAGWDQWKALKAKPYQKN